jgi:hypothetical protein
LTSRSRSAATAEPDNNNPFGNETGFPATLADQKKWYLEVAAQSTRARGLSVGQKNASRRLTPTSSRPSTGTLNEQCFQYDECDASTGDRRGQSGVLHRVQGQAEEVLP